MKYLSRKSHCHQQFYIKYIGNTVCVTKMKLTTLWQKKVSVYNEWVQPMFVCVCVNFNLLNSPFFI